MDVDIPAYLERQATLLQHADRITHLLNRTWVSENFPSDPGVYMLWKGEEIVYVGETGNLRGRMRDMIDSRNHTLRRTLGTIHFCDHPLYTKATSHKRHCNEIEHLIDEIFTLQLKISIQIVKLGRKELEELLIKRYNPVYNKKGLRITG